CTTVSSDVCETDLSITPDHCGACTNACPAQDNAAPTCVSSSCGTSCQGAFADCDLDAQNGCEADTAHDAANCGACGTTCSGTAAYCASGCVALAGAAGVQQNLSQTDVQS